MYRIFPIYMTSELKAVVADYWALESSYITTEEENIDESRRDNNTAESIL